MPHEFKKLSQRSLVVTWLLGEHRWPGRRENPALRVFQARSRSWDGFSDH
jgi:hypothetical protein